MDVENLVKDAVIKASTTFRKDQMDAYTRALKEETNENARWILELLIENANVAEHDKVPLCDDTGIPHVYVEVGDAVQLPGGFFSKIRSGVESGLRELPARPMAVRGNVFERIEQKKGLYDDPGRLLPAPFSVGTIPGDSVRIHVLMLGGGPEIRSHTYKVFHRRDYRKVFVEVITWLRSEVPMLGCTPCIPAVGIGRTHFEASSLMLKAMAYGNLNDQSEIEGIITESLNNSKVGALGIGGSVTALGSFVKVGPQRASGVRIVCMRPCCCVEPRRSSVYLTSESLE
jgi:fumarate hydratase subunit alpha